MSASKKNKKKNVESKRIQEITEKIEKFQEINEDSNNKASKQEENKTSKSEKTNKKNEKVEIEETPKDSEHKEAGEEKPKNKKKNKKSQSAEETKKEEQLEESKDKKETQDKKEEPKSKKKSKKGKKVQDEQEKVEEKESEEARKPKIEEKQEVAKEEPRESALITTSSTKEGKPEYIKEILKARRKKTAIFICVILLIILIIGFSTIFAILNLNSEKITKGVSVRGIDLSDLTIQEASEKLFSNFEDELLPELKLTYNDEYSTSVTAEQIDFKYSIEDAVKDAYNVGRSENILINNYVLLFTTFMGRDLDIDYTVNEERLNAFVDDINSKIPGLVVDPGYYIEENKLIIESGKDGIEVQKEELKKEILNSFSSRILDEVSKENYSQTINIPTQIAKASDIDMDKVYSEIYREPQDAYFELDPYKIYPDIDGIDLQISLEEAKKQITGDAEEYQFDLKITKASKTIKDLGTEAFPYEISSFSTRYDASNTNRSTNLRIAAEKINGTVLMPGEVFSYNKTVGKRTVEEGYKDAKIYADGGVIDGLAGGICQISSTLYNAVLLANLEIVERRNHSFTTSYVAAGRDATVVWGTIDFQFKNSRNYPIKIEASVKNGVAEFKIHGMQEQEEYEISILPQTTSSIPYSTTYVDDQALMPGQQIVSQAGHLGYKVTTYIVKKLNGVEVSREVLSSDTYQPMRAIIRRGPMVPTM